MHYFWITTEYDQARGKLTYVNWNVQHKLIKFAILPSALGSFCRLSKIFANVFCNFTRLSVTFVYLPFSDKKTPCFQTLVRPLTATNTQPVTPKQLVRETTRTTAHSEATFRTLTTVSVKKTTMETEDSAHVSNCSIIEYLDLHQIKEPLLYFDQKLSQYQLNWVQT